MYKEFKYLSHKLCVFWWLLQHIHALVSGSLFHQVLTYSSKSFFKEYSWKI